MVKAIPVRLGMHSLVTREFIFLLADIGLEIATLKNCTRATRLLHTRASAGSRRAAVGGKDSSTQAWNCGIGSPDPLQVAGLEFAMTRPSSQARQQFPAACAAGCRLVC